MLVVGAIGVVAGALFVGSRLVSVLAGASADGGDRRRRRLLAWIDTALAGLFVLCAVVALGAGGWTAAMPGSIVLRAAAHLVAASLWLGALLATLLLPRTGLVEDEVSRTLDRASRRVWTLALGLLAIVAGTGAAASWSVDGWPALVGTRYGRLLVLQAALFALSLGFMAAFVRHLPRPDGKPSAAGPARLLTIEIGFALAMVVVAAMLTGLAAGSAEPTVWPFPVRLAPDVMLRFPTVQDQVISGTGIVIVGVLAAIGGYRLRRWRPLLLAGAALLLVAGMYRALAAMTIDAYPTTYSKPPLGSAADSIRRGRDLFAANCVPCHGPGGRGDGPAAAGLLQRPADLTAPHTADHTPGDLFWWITHGLGLSMPAFRGQLSPTERWDLVNFVRTLAQDRPAPAEAQPTPSTSR
jgi:mono/diheme cytochrome c family protein/putative copper export protein